MADSTALTLYDLLVTRDFEPEVLDSQGKAVTDPAEAELFSFDYKTENNNYGTVVILLGQDQELEVYFGDNLGRTMEGDDKRGWYRFLEQLKEFAVRNLLRFELNNLSRLKYTMQGMAAIKEGLFESYHGGRRVSYSGPAKQSRLMIRHSRDLGENDARYRAIESLFIETADGERFKLPFRNLTGGRAMLTHVREGGTPYDAIGQHISQIMSEMATLSRFIRAARGRDFQGEARAMVESAIRHYQDLKTKAKRMISRRGYLDAVEAYDPGKFTDSEVTAEAIRDMFLERTLDHRIEEAIPVLARLAEEQSKMTETQEFESWAETVAEGTWALPDTPQDKEKLSALMSQELIVGPDATNATEQLYDLIGDDRLFDILDDLALRDPDANVWNDRRVQKRLEQLGITDQPSTKVSETLQGPAVGSGLPLRLHEMGRDPGFEVDGWRYDSETERDDDVVKTWHTATGPDGERVTIDYDPYDVMTPDTFRLWLKLGRPGRISGGPLDKETIESMARTAGVARLDRDMARAGMEEDLDTDGVMMNKPSNMSSESREYNRFRQLIELAKG